MSCESVVLLFAAIIANAGETKQFLIKEFKMQKVKGSIIFPICTFLYQPIARPTLVFFFFFNIFLIGGPRAGLT